MRLRTLAGALAVALSVCAPAFADNDKGVSDLVTTTALSTVSGGCLTANADRRALTLDNTGGSIAIGYCRTSPSTPGTACTAAIGTAGTATLSAGTRDYWPSGSAPQNQICFIAASGTPSITIIEGR